MTEIEVELDTFCVYTCLSSVTVNDRFQSNIPVLYEERAKCWFRLTHISYCLSPASDPVAILGLGWAAVKQFLEHGKNEASSCNCNVNDLKVLVLQDLC